MNDQFYGAELIKSYLLFNGISANVESFYNPSKPTYFSGFLFFFSVKLLLGVYIHILRVNTIFCDLEKSKG